MPDAGDHLLEVKYNSHWQSAAFPLAFIPDDTIVCHSEDLSAALAALPCRPCGCGL